MPLIRKDAGQTPPPPGKDLLVTGSIAERRAVARAMAEPAHVAALSAALAREQDQSVREAILTSLCRVASAESAAAIIPLIRSNEASVRRAALDALISMPDAVAVHLDELLADPDSDVRLLSCEIVRRLPADRATAILSKLLNEDAVVNVCATAIDVLAEIGTPAALPALRAAGARFTDQPFLQFAVQDAIERISAASAARD